MKNIISIDLGGSKLIVAVITKDGNIIAQSRQEILNTIYTKEAIRERINKGIFDIKKKIGQLNADVVGISIPGPCDPEKGIFLHNFTTKIDDWNIAADIYQDTQLPVYIENDVNACAVGEKYFGLCKNESDYLWMTISFGCGGALYINNSLYRGKGLLAGEIGHIQVEYNNPRLCGCGQFGDMEAEGSGIAIGSKYLERIGQEPNPNFHSKHVSELARQGDVVAKEIFFESGFYIGKLCAMVSNLLNIPIAVIGGGVAVYDYDILKPGIDKALDKYVFPISKGKFSVVKTELGYNASLLGAAAITLNRD